MSHFLRLPLTALCALLVLSGCQKTEEPDRIEAVLVGEASIADGSTIGCGSGATERTLSFSTNRDWKISLTDQTDVADWISFSEMTGVAGDNSVGITLKENLDGKQRSCPFIIISGAAYRSYSIVQETAYIFDVSEDTFEVGPEASSISFTVTANTEYDIAFSEGCDWISRVITKGTTSEELSFAVEDNDNYESREAVISIHAEGGSSRDVAVKQEGRGVFSITKTTYSLEAEASSFAVIFRTNMKYEVSFSEGCDWLKQVITKGVTREELTFTASANESVESREGGIIIRAENGDCQIITVTQKAKETFTIAQTTIAVPASGGGINITVISNLEYSVSSLPSWIKASTPASVVSSTVKVHSFTVAENSSNSARTGGIVFRSSKNDQAEVKVTQKSNSFDGVVKQLKKATVGKGVDIVITGDAYLNTASDMASFDSFATKGMNALFEEEPFKSLENRFNVYSVKAVSATNVIGSGTKFSTSYGSGTLISGNNNAVFSFVSEALPSLDLTETLILTILNNDKYAGTCFLFSDNKAVAYVPANSNSVTFGNLVRHEAGGHAFGKLADEYFNGEETIPASKVLYYLGWKSYSFGFYENVDFTSDPSEVIWSKFLNDPNYSGTLGVFEGGFTYRYGVYRPSDNSIMRNNTGGYNAPSREAIYKKAMRFSEGSGWVYDYDAFVEFDAPSRTPSLKVSSVAEWSDSNDFIPLAPPVMIVVE